MKRLNCCGICEHRDIVLKHNKPEILLMDKIKRMVQIINIAYPFDTRVLEKENEKITNYQDIK